MLKFEAATNEIKRRKKFTMIIRFFISCYSVSIHRPGKYIKFNRFSKILFIEALMKENVF